MGVAAAVAVAGIVATAQCGGRVTVGGRAVVVVDTTAAVTRLLLVGSLGLLPALSTAIFKPNLEKTRKASCYVTVILDSVLSKILFSLRENEKKCEILYQTQYISS